MHCWFSPIVRPFAFLFAVTAIAASTHAADAPIDFNRDIRPILSNRCWKCHGPDEKERQAGLRFDSRDGVLAKLESGKVAVVVGKPDESELIRRILSSDETERMPPAGQGKPLEVREVELLRAWVQQGAKFAKHWSYEKPERPAVPTIENQKSKIKNPIDNFILARLAREGLTLSPEADRHALGRRVALDITGLPPTVAEIEAFVKDSDPQAYEKFVDRMLAKESYGEHWARQWLDLARYADSAGYADDPARTIWGYRDWVIKAFNKNMPFDQFTIEQIAGDLLPNPTPDQLIATAFHRNTLTNNEGGTNDEEFRNVAIVDRVNTTMATWMGTTIACAQCHTHKYDPITQEEFFKLFAILNQTQDADRPDESPRLDLFTTEQLQQKETWLADVARLEKETVTATPVVMESLAKWDAAFPRALAWKPLKPTSGKSDGGVTLNVAEDGTIRADKGAAKATYAIEIPVAAGKLNAVRLDTLPDDALPGKGAGFGGGNFVLSRVSATLTPPNGTRLNGRFVRVELPGKARFLHLAEVQVFTGNDNLAPKGEAKQSTTDYGGEAKRANDGNTSGEYTKNSVSHTALEDNPWWEVDLKTEQPIDRVVLWNRTDAATEERMRNFKVLVLNDKHEPVWSKDYVDPPKPSSEFALSGVRGVPFTTAFADHDQGAGFEAKVVLAPQANKGWSVGGKLGQPHSLTLLTSAPVEIAEGSTLTITLEQTSSFENHVLGKFRLSLTDDPRAAESARVPAPILAILNTPSEKRSDAQRDELTKFYLTIAPELAAARDQLAATRKSLTDLKPATTVPILRELAADKLRKTNIQLRGNFMDLGKEVTPGVPAAFHPLPEGSTPDRLALAKWLIDDNNPLTARVLANRYWETIFGNGLVRTSEEFGSQGDQPTHPELLDWLAVEVVRLKWDTKALLKLIVTSATYRQSSKISPELLDRDPENYLLARGPRFRLSAEMIRDQALAVSGLLSPKMHGPPVKPFQPNMGVSAAFGSGIDWQASAGEDKFRRGLYTTWRRSNPYPSMSAFDAPNREVCTVRRARTNTPLQALVTLNDPVYIEAAQALARTMAKSGTTPADHIRAGFQQCASRPPSDSELANLTQLFHSARERLAKDVEKARKLATMPLGPLPEGADPVELAAWTVVGNVLLNLDEMFMRR
ncbi:MAG: DUF1553 domain-containing protein [Planctomycetaceae bacterium]